MRSAQLLNFQRLAAMQMRFAMLYVLFKHNA